MTLTTDISSLPELSWFRISGDYSPQPFTDGRADSHMISVEGRCCMILMNIPIPTRSSRSGSFHRTGEVQRGILLKLHLGSDGGDYYQLRVSSMAYVEHHLRICPGRHMADNTVRKKVQIRLSMKLTETSSDILEYCIHSGCFQHQ